MLNFKILNGKSLFCSKNHAQKTPSKNKKKFGFAKKSLKVFQNQEQASELALQVKQASHGIQKRKGKPLSQPKTGNSVF